MFINWLPVFMWCNQNNTLSKMLTNIAETKLFIIYNLRKIGWAVKMVFAFFKRCVFKTVEAEQVSLLMCIPCIYCILLNICL